MHFGTYDQLILLALLVVLVALLVAAPALRIPYPILLVLGGLALGFVPGLPTISLPPDIVLVAVLPPLLYLSAYNTSLRDLRANVRSIGTLAIGLVLATTATVAVVAHVAIDGLSWPAAFVLGAVVSPTDPIAATAIMRRLGVPRRIVTVVEGRASSTTAPRSSSTRLRSPLRSRAASPSGMCRGASSGVWPAGSGSVSSSATSWRRCAAGSTTRRSRSRSG